ncbi:hypothetical protein BLNAU_24798 [Blattamonas nauphoetae]|uniref:Uncharacterized protein n=1 Tax=Blattamonas nauphoetae TaxID=2049346 RepID=A0ABQ9WNH0_9EUKA|nr:hypothetical protein BLNAU_24798 [Blattamonas nauphoetae]
MSQPVKKDKPAKTVPADGDKRRASEAPRDILELHLSRAEVGAPGNRHLEPRDGDHELVHQRHLRADCDRGVAAGSVQRTPHADVARDPDGSAADPAWGACEARGERGHEVGDENPSDLIVIFSARSSSVEFGSAVVELLVQLSPDCSGLPHSKQRDGCGECGIRKS